MTSLGAHLRLLKNGNLRHVSAKMLGITCDFSFSTMRHVSAHNASRFRVRARGFRFRTGFGAWGLRFRLAGSGITGFRVQGWALGFRV